MPLNAAIQRIQRLMGFNGVLTDGAGGSAQTYLSNLVGPGSSDRCGGRPKICDRCGGGRIERRAVAAAGSIDAPWLQCLCGGATSGREDQHDKIAKCRVTVLWRLQIGGTPYRAACSETPPDEPRGLRPPGPPRPGRPALFSSPLRGALCRGALKRKAREREESCGPITEGSGRPALARTPTWDGD